MQERVELLSLLALLAFTTSTKTTNTAAEARELGVRDSDWGAPQRVLIEALIEPCVFIEALIKGSSARQRLGGSSR